MNCPILRVVPVACSSFVIVLSMLLSIAVIKVTHAQIATSITSTTGTGNLGTTVTQAGTVYNITGGTRAGTNLFHSFGNFTVGAPDTANFLNTPVGGTLPSTSNILGRVTGGSISNIFGTIQTTGFGSANLFLMNPAGFLFGPNATVNVGGMATFTTADYMRLADGKLFNAIPDAGSDALLSTAPVAAFGFLGSNPGAITVQGSQLALSPGQGISLIGGNITVQGATLDDGTVQTAKLSAPGGQINLVSVASPGEVLYPSLQYGPNSNGQSFSNMGTIALSQAKLDVSGDAAGTVKIRGGQFVMTEATLSADSINSNGAPTAIDINVTGDLLISNDTVPALTAKTTGAGDAGAVRILSANLTATSNTTDILTLIDTHTSGTGKAGNIDITTGNLQVMGSLTGGFTAFIDSGTEGPGHGGDVTITARNIQIENSLISTGNFLANVMGEDATGSAGNVTISSDNLQLSFSQIATDGFSLANGTGRAGDITISTHDINLNTSQISSQGFERGGTIAIKTDTLFATNSQIATQGNLTTGGGVTLTGNVIELSTGSTIASSTGGDGDAGSITVSATDHLGLLGASGADRPSGIFSNSFGTVGSAGNAGNIVITTPTLEMTGGSRINTTTASSGRGGNVTINTSNSISISGETGGFAPEPLFSLGSIQPSGIFTKTIGGHCSGLCGNAGNISISTGLLTIGSGARIDSGTSSNGTGGNISINTGTASISGTLTDGSPAGIFSRTVGIDTDSGPGGTISLTAAQSVSLTGGSSIAASSTGPANAGNIFIDAGHSFTATNSSVKTDAAQASGGNITVNASDIVHLTNSQINASVQGAQTTIGGNVTIDPSFVILQNSQILAQATQGQGGNISITTNSLLSDTGSLISASSQSGVNGTVSVQSPISQAGGKIIPLSKTTLETAPLLSQRCAALASGQYSSFVVAGRDALPVEPGSWLASPLIELPTLRSAEMGMNRVLVLNTSPDTPEAAIVSVRRISRAGSVARLLETDWLIGCES